MSVYDLNSSLAGINCRARGLRSKSGAALAVCFAFAVVGQANAAAIRMNETAMVAVAIPQSCDMDAASGGLSLAFHFGASVIPMIQSASIATPVPSPLEEATGRLPMRADLTAPERQEIVAAGEAVVGIASTYNPGDPTDLDAGNAETASGERYDADSWTAAIRTDLRGKFGGVRFGRNYQPTFALVEAGDKSFIVKINDVGPLKPGRIIDLNVRSMRYLDPTMQRGLVADVKVTPLAGQDWALGPVTDPGPVTVASREDDVRKAR